MNVFIDTNVWFSAFYGSPNSEKIIKAHTEGKINAAISHTVLWELAKNINQKIPQAFRPLKKFLEYAPPMIITDPKTISENVRGLVEAKDQKIFQAAVNSKADLFVTGNLKDFNIPEIHKKFKIKVVSPQEAAKYLKLTD
jgi:putative PIN family toxin of toxin-antitoxin system